ncbi:GGA [Mytilus edulis]|uniref:GGA n=1 Tax=Mytilus edulis TaxID=6550 RepID=A0A8S3V1K9_MYTED|nr:GGA [Mytilus edulis]
MAEEDRSLETLLNRATNPANRDEDWEHILAFCDQVNKEIEGSQIAVKLLAHKLQSPQEREALYALTTLEGCVKNCGKKFHQEIGKFRFLNEIIKVVSPKYLGKATTEKVKRRCIELIYSWSRGLPQEAKILDAYKMLKQQGVVKEDPTYIDKTLDTFPPPQPREKNAIFEDDDKANLLQKLLRSKNPQDLQAANRLIKNMVKQDTERMDKISRRINQLQEIDNNVKLLNEMLAHYTKQNSSQSDRDMMKELYDTLEKLRPNLFRLASDVDEKDNTGIDHSYDVTSKKIVPDISNIVHEEVLDNDGNNLTPTDDWRIGRRVVELGVIADHLQQCKHCGLPLSLHNIIDIKTYGLGSVLKVLCTNKSCGNINAIPTGKQHDHKIWDVNTKLALAAIDLGLGEHQINGLLSILNIPTVSHCMIDSRIREVGDVIESVADQSMEEWTEREKEMTRESDGNDNVTVSVDAAWQRRGSGRSYDSLTGHCSMIGSKTGKVINYKWRSKACRICQRAETSGNIPRVHKCNKNFTGSAKAMEPDMVVDMVKESRSKGANITAIIGDEDTTTIARLRAKVDPTIVKLSDSNHMKNPLEIVCKGQPKKIEENLHALSKHPFGDHSSCSTDWCRFIADPSIKYKSLPYGKPLQDKALQESLTTLFQKYILNSEKLANLGSTQSNESFNKSVAAKAPKNRFYGGSRSLAYRVAAAVAQKNTGHRYTVDVNVSSGLSPGLYTRKLATLRDIQARKRKAVAITTEAKLRRIALKASRNQSSSTFEVREGVCYQSNTMIDTATEDSDEKILEIPAPKNKPVENDSKPDISTMTHIYFDIEATGLGKKELIETKPSLKKRQYLILHLGPFCIENFTIFYSKNTPPLVVQHGRTSHITQISARRGLETFSKYILPAREITPKAAEVTGLTFQNGSLYLLDKIVPAVGVKEGLTDVQKVFQSELSVFYNYVSLKQMNKNVPSLKQMLDDKVVTKRTANCIARSGLNLSHLRLAYSRNGRTADILTTNDDAMRVLASYKKIVEGSTSDESNLAGAGNLSSLLDLNEPSSPAKPDTSTAPSTDILDEELLALGLGDSKTDDPNKSTTLLGDLDDIFSAVTQQNTVPASQTGLQTTNIFSMPSMQGGTFQSQPLNQFNTGQPTQLSTQQVQRPPQYNNQAFSQPQQPSQGWSFQGTPTVAPSQQNKTAQQSTTTTSMGDIDLLGQSLMQQSLPKEYIKPIIPPPEKKTLNQMSTKTTDGPLLATVSPFTTSQTTVTLSSPVISSTTATPVTTPKQGEVQPLNDVFVSIESVQPGTSPPINAYDKNGMKIVIHIAKNRPREDVHVMVVSVMSTNTSAVKNFSFQAAVPKAMKVKLQPPSATDLPLYNPILPPSAITQIMLLANPQNERIRLKYKITYSLDSESRSDVGEVDNFVFS